MTLTFSETLRKNLLIFDGPMGTELYRHHVFTNRCFEELNLTEPPLIEQVLTDYRNAGADVLTTNTFGANRPNLEKYGLAEKLADINRAGAAIARKVAGDSLFVAGSIGSVKHEQFILGQVDARYPKHEQGTCKPGAQ